MMLRGLVFVDPADFTETKADWNQISGISGFMKSELMKCS